MMDNLYKFPQQTLYWYVLNSMLLRNSVSWKILCNGSTAPTLHEEAQRLYTICPKPCGFPGGTSSKESTCQSKRLRRLRFIPWVGKTPWRKKWQLTPLFLPGETHGQRSLVGCSPVSQRVKHDWASENSTHVPFLTV